MSDLEDAIREFLIEGSEALDGLDRDLVELERDPDSPALIARIFRNLHTIKGTSGVFGFNTLSAVAHAGENLLSQMRAGRLRLTSAITSALLGLMDALRIMLSNIAAKGSEGKGNYAPVIAAVHAVMDPASPAGRENPGVASSEVEPVAASPASAPAGAGVVSPATSVGSAAAAGEGSRISSPDPAVLTPAADAAPAPPAGKAAGGDEDKRDAPGAGTIRVDTHLLDRVMDLVGELVLARNQVLQYTAVTKDAAFLSAAQRLNLITTELQEGLMKAPMQPVGNLWGKFARVVRDLAVQYGKEVHIEMEGADTELDKTILEAIHDPLLHIVRNAVSHGIETPARRRQVGKPPRGKLLLRASREGGQVNLDISDDGAGLDVAGLKRAAVQRGVIGSEQAAQMSNRETFRLVFAAPPGATAHGMGAVKTCIEGLGGMVDLYSAAGEGTTVRLKIPLTLAIIPAMIVLSRSQRFAIPQVSVLELVRLEEEQAKSAIENLHGAPVFRLRGNLLPLVDLAGELCLGAHAGRRQDQAVNIVVLQADGRLFGLMVDEVHDTEEIVVKPLGKQLKGIGLFAGATIMGDGRVALIVDVLGLAQAANMVTQGRSEAALSPGMQDGAGSAALDSWLVFRAGGTSRMAVPLPRVSRIEEIPAGQVESSGKCAVVQYRGHIMPLLRVSELLPDPSAGSAASALQVIVCAAGERPVGLVVDEVLDIVEQQIVPEPIARRSGVLASAVIKQRVTDVLDVDTLVARNRDMAGRAEITSSDQGGTQA